MDCAPGTVEVFDPQFPTEPIPVVPGQVTAQAFDALGPIPGRSYGFDPLLVELGLVDPNSPCHNPGPFTLAADSARTAELFCRTANQFETVGFGIPKIRPEVAALLGGSPEVDYVASPTFDVIPALSFGGDDLAGLQNLDSIGNLSALAGPGGPNASGGEGSVADVVASSIKLIIDSTAGVVLNFNPFAFLAF